jgi:Rhodopirellula transposase DDE domain
MRQYEKKEAHAMSSAGVKRWSIDGKATVKIGEFSRGGRTRGDNRASDHELGGEETEVPCGIVDEESGEWALTFGRSYTTSDCIVDVIDAKWEAMAEQEQTETSLIPINMDNGPESSGRRTPCLSRMVQLAAVINKPMQLRYYPPYPSKYNPIESGWGLLALQWHGAKLIEVDTMLGWAKEMTWKGLHPVVERSRKVYEKGLALSKMAMEAVEARLKRDPPLPKDDIVINPASTS